MTPRDGAGTVVDECLDISEEERVVVPDDGHVPGLIESLLELLEERSIEFERLEYEEPDRQGQEPPRRVAEEMKQADVFVAPTAKSISHTRARNEACEAGARGATLPGITREIWNTSLQADYQRVAEISEKVLEMISRTDEVRITTPSGTDLRIDVEPEYYHADTGLIHEPGDFGNLPAGEADGGAVNVRGDLVVDHLPMVPDRNEGAVLEVEDSEVVSWENVPGDAELVETLESVEGARNIAEFGFGTNPEAEVIGNTLNDEKVLGTVHIALGDNASYIPEGDPLRQESDIHWDTVCISPTVYFDGKKVLDAGEPVFLDQDI
ncbi:MAG: aminopeptidase [Candidatus Nanohaloarchaea archaeon]